jgi:uncharacterized membrane protein
MKGGLARMSFLHSLEFHNPAFFKMDGTAAVIFYFTVYSLIGWLLENSYSLYTNRVFLKPNFLHGPFKPMYGIAPVLLIYFMMKEPNWITVIFLCFFIPTIVEYISGLLLLKFFHRQWWDYSDMPLQLHGHICLPFALCWIVLSIICLRWIHPIIVGVYGAIELYWDKIYLAIILYFLADLFFTIRKYQRSYVGKPANPIH